MAFHVTYNFVQGYDLGQKKIVASEVDQNFADIEGYINNSSVNIVDTQTITGDKTFSGVTTFSGDSTFSGNVTLPASAVSGTSVALDGSNVSSIGSTLSTYMAHAAMTSGRKVALSFPASGGIVTAPADGYFCAYACGRQGTYEGAIGLNVYASGNSGTICLSAMSLWYGGSGTWIFVPVSAGQSVAVNYASTIEPSSATIYFSYVNGSAPTV